VKDGTRLKDFKAERSEELEIMTVEPRMIQNETDADEYLSALLERHEYRSMNEVTRRAQKYIKDEHLKIYFLNKCCQAMMRKAHAPRCASSRQVTLARVRAKIADLRAMERVLADAVRRCAAAELSDCPIIDALSVA
jgi:hypothetical protein